MNTLKLFFICAGTCLFVGCSVDTLAIIEHPEGAKPNSQFSVAMLNNYVYLVNSSRIMLPVTRDSLHVAFGLPQGWAVEGVKYYVASDLDLVAYMADSSMTEEEMSEAFGDSLAVYLSRATAMTADPGIATAFAGRTFTANNPDLDSIVVQADDVGQWLGYGAKVNITLAAGSECDTFFVNDSLEGLDSLGGGMSLDTIGMSLVPVFIFAVVEVGPDEDTVNLFYYSKTGVLPPAQIDSSDMTALTDQGYMAYVPLNVSSTLSVRDRISAQARTPAPEIYPNPFRQGTSVRIGTGMNSGGIRTAAIYSASGVLVRTLSANTGPQSRMVWDGLDDGGRTCLPGVYLVKFSAGGKSFCRSVTLMQ
jgi:hypothetical protein